MRAPSPQGGRAIAEQTTPTAIPFPSHRDLYLLAAGLLLGVLMGPAVLGQVAPETYDRLFVGRTVPITEGPGLMFEQQLERTRLRNAEALRTLEATGVSGVAIEEERARREADYRQLEQDVRALRAAPYDRWFTARLFALVAAMVLVMAAEAALGPEPRAGRSAVVPRALGRLITVRYALVAVWLALALARPQTLAQLPWLFIVVLLAVAAAVAFVPLGPRREEPA